MMKTFCVKFYHDKHILCHLLKRWNISSVDSCLLFIQQPVKKATLCPKRAVSLVR